MDAADNNCLFYNIEAESQLCFVLMENSVSLKLQEGYAEIFGSELIKGKMYKFLPPASIALYTWQGCSVKLYGKPRKTFLEKDSSMFNVAYMHSCLEEMRIKAESQNTRGPVSLVVGPPSVGKSSFCRILLNYAARQGRQPLYIDLNVHQNSACLPGGISILPVEKPCDITKGFMNQAAAVYSFGYTTPCNNVPLYLLIIKQLGKKIQAHLENVNNKARFSGVIIDTYPTCYKANALAASAFGVDVVFVISCTKLCLRLRKVMPAVKVVFVPKQSGVFIRSKIFRSRTRDNCVWDYFYGLKRRLYPHKFEIKFSDIEIYKISPSSRMRGRMDVSFDDVRIIKVSIGEDLLYHILGLSYSTTADENLFKTNVVGFVCITSVSLRDKSVTLLSPQPYPLPSKILLMGNVKLK